MIGDYVVKDSQSNNNEIVKLMACPLNFTKKQNHCENCILSTICKSNNKSLKI